jgi:hypothetical protein
VAVSSLLSLLLLLLLSATPALAAPPTLEEKAKAREHYQKGLTHYDIKEYSDALAEFKNAYRVVQDPAFLFNIAQCYRKLGQDIEALDYYRNYLRRFPNAPNHAEVERRIQEIERELAAARTPAATPAPAPAGSAPRPAAPPNVEATPGRTPASEPIKPLAAPSPAPGPTPPAMPPAGTGPTPPAAVVTASADTGAGAGEPAFYQRWWFWTGVGAVVAVGVATGIALATRGEIGDCRGISPCRTVGD